MIVTVSLVEITGKQRLWKRNGNLPAYSINTTTSAPEPAPIDEVPELKQGNRNKYLNISEQIILVEEENSTTAFQPLQPTSPQEPNGLQKQISPLEVLLSRLVPGPIQDDYTHILFFLLIHTDTLLLATKFIELCTN